MLEAPARGPKTLLSGVIVVLTATPETWAQSALLGVRMTVCLCFLGFTSALPFSRSLLIPQMSSLQLLLPDQYYCRNIELFHFPFWSVWIWFLIDFEYKRIKKKIGSCFPSIVWINWNSSNRSMSNSFHLSGLSFPESNWGGRKGGDLD